jgi:hypothetical protein
MAALTAMALVSAPATASAAAGYCGISWGSGEKSSPTMTNANLVGLRAAGHDCWDRLVFDVPGPVGGYLVSYVDEVTHDPTGNPVPLRGGAKLQVTIFSAAYDQSGTPTYVYPNPAELVNVTGFQTFRQVAWAGSFEGTTTVGLGVRARLPFRVFNLADRIVVDVAHFW